jgi:hypothetical protein
MKKLIEAAKLYDKLEEEFTKGDPNSDLNKACKTKRDLAIFAMLRFASTQKGE